MHRSQGWQLLAGLLVRHSVMLRCIIPAGMPLLYSGNQHCYTPAGWKVCLIADCKNNVCLIALVMTDLVPHCDAVRNDSSMAHMTSRAKSSADMYLVHQPCCYIIVLSFSTTSPSRDRAALRILVINTMSVTSQSLIRSIVLSLRPPRMTTLRISIP